MQFALILKTAVTVVGLVTDVVDMVQGLRGKRPLTKEELRVAAAAYEATMKLNEDLMNE